MSPDVLLECPRTSLRDVLRVNVTERVWHSPLGPSPPISKQPLWGLFLPKPSLQASQLQIGLEHFVADSVNCFVCIWLNKIKSEIIYIYYIIWGFQTDLRIPKVIAVAHVRCKLSGSDIFPDVSLARAAHHTPEIMARSHFDGDGDEWNGFIKIRNIFPLYRL